MVAPRASYQLWLASPSYDAPSVQLNERGNPIITSAKHSHNSKLITKKSTRLTSARKPLEIKGFRAFYVLIKMLLQHFCNAQGEKREREWLQVAN